MVVSGASRNCTGLEYTKPALARRVESGIQGRAFAGEESGKER